MMWNAGREAAREPARGPANKCAGRPDGAARIAALALAALLFAGCSGGSRGFSPSETGVSASPRIAGADVNGPLPKGGGVRKLGDPYVVSGRTFVPRDEPGYDRVGLASWYGDDFHGRRTANGEIYDMNALTAAHPTLPLPSYAYVTNVSNQRTILVRINDRGPYVADRVIDLSRASARALGMEGRGLGQVRVRYAGPAPLDGNDSRERQYLASRGAPQPTASVAWTEPAPQTWPSQSASGGWSPDVYRSGLLRR